MNSAGDSQCWAVVPAAGSGSRFGANQPKQYELLLGISVLEHALTSLLNEKAIAGIVVSLPPSDSEPAEAKSKLSARLRNNEKLRFAIGGATRAASVLSGLDVIDKLASPTDFVLVHDAARPLLHRDDLANLVSSLRCHSVGGILASPVVDTIKKTSDHICVDMASLPNVVATQSRKQLWAAQTPQMFKMGILRDALVQALREGIAVTDESMAVELTGQTPAIVAAQYSNFKITHRQDLLLAEAVLNTRRDGRDV